MFSLLLRNLFFTLLQPGLVAGLVPFFILKNTHGSTAGVSFFEKTLALALGTGGLLLMLDCIRRFAVEGRGTLSPADPTQRLVASGPYRFSRNPMYVGVMGVLLGEALFFRSGWLWAYAGGVFLLFNLFVFFVEEPRLRRDFGEAYAAYCRRVRRWL